MVFLEREHEACSLKHEDYTSVVFTREQPCQVGDFHVLANRVAKEKPTYREVAESIYWGWPFLQLGCSVRQDIFKERFHGWLME